MADGGPFGPASVVVFGLLSAALWGAADFSGGILSKRVSVFAVVLGGQLAGTVVAVLLAVVRGEALPAPADVLWSVLAGIAVGVGILALYDGLAKGRMSVVAPVTGVLAATIPVLAGIVLQGLPPGLALVGIGLAIVAVVLVSRAPDTGGGPSGLSLALVAGVGLGLFNVLVSRVDPTLVFGPLVVVRLTGILLVVAAILVTRPSLGIPRRLLPAIVVVGFLDMGGNAGFLFAESTGQLAVASVLSSLYPVVTVILAALVLREPVTRSHTAGIVLALAAIALIAGNTA